MIPRPPTYASVTRRSLLVGAAALASAPAVAQSAPAVAQSAPVRVATLRFGSVAWELDVIRAHGLDRAAGVTIETAEYAATQAAQVALQAGRVDMAVQDWLWVSRQRGSGADWTFAPATSAVGAVVTQAESPVRTLADLAGRRLGIAGGPLDKSWLILRAYASKTLGLDLDAKADKVFGAPPLLLEQLRAGRVDAALTYWPYAARAEAEGMRAVLTMETAVSGLGVSPRTPVLGWVFSEQWAGRAGSGLRQFLDASRKARDILGTSDSEWDRVAPLTGASSPGELVRLRDWYRSGIPEARGSGRDDAARLYDILAATGGPALVGPAPHLAAGTFWQSDDVAPG
jgi:NitT/TauT family transport system substrate-binding protein